MGDERPDFLSAMVSLDVPLFRAKRQDQRLVARQEDAQAALRARDGRLRELRRELRALHAEMLSLARRSRLYEEVLEPRAAETTRAALNAYQSDAADFPTLMRAQLAELETRLEALEVASDHARARAGVLYFSEDPR
jgi:outer membrane protein TolC